MIDNMLEYYNMIKKFNVDIIYSGALWSDGIEGLGYTLRKHMELEHMPLSASQSVFSVFVEQMNNMLMYAAEREDIEGHPDAPKGIFILSSKGKVYKAQSGNVMKLERAELIKSRIDHLNTMDKAALRKHYMEKVRGENTNPESKGAGIGLIEIAKRASAPIEYEFVPYDDGRVFFTICVTIGG
jgi:hypothetical protein